MRDIQPQVYSTFNPRFVQPALGLGDHQPMVTKLSPLGIYIEARLRHHGKQQNWLAEQMEVSDNAVSKWKKTGKISRDNFLTLIKILGPQGAPNIEPPQELEPDAAAVLEFYRLRATDKERVVMQVMAGYKVEHVLSPSPDTQGATPLAKSKPHRAGAIDTDVTEDELREALDGKKKARKAGLGGVDD